MRMVMIMPVEESDKQKVSKFYPTEGGKQIFKFADLQW